MSIGEWHNEDIYEPTGNIGPIVAITFFAVFTVLIVVFVARYALSAPYKTELHFREGNQYICEYYTDEIKCELSTDPDIGFGREQ